jgi:hypothetical protein
MLGPLDLLINGFLVVILFPLVVVSLLTGSKPPKASVFGLLYGADSRLMLAGNVMLLAVSATAAAKLAFHFGLIDAATELTLSNWLSVPLLILLALFLILFVRAVVRVCRSA